MSEKNKEPILHYSIKNKMVEDIMEKVKKQRKRNKKIWRGWTPCKKCNGRKTYGGIKKWFGFKKITQWSHDCKCTRYEGQTELDKQKCEEFLKEKKDENEL